MTREAPPISVLIIWDYDTALGQVNSSYPYLFDESKLYQEIENTERILSMAASFDVRMTFACVGFAAEPGVYPYHIPEQIVRIHAAGHEVASHSWRHEWFPLIEAEQVRKSLARSKYALEACLGVPGAVTGFVPPFSRPMTWLSRGAVSRGDRAFGRQYPGADLGRLLRFVSESGYDWCRVAYEPLWRKLGFRGIESRLRRSWSVEAGVHCIPQHYTGFDDPAQRLLDVAIETGEALVLVGHPAALSRQGTESEADLADLLARLEREQRAGRVQTRTVQAHFSCTVRRVEQPA